jgi:hypothetical protein
MDDWLKAALSTSFGFTAGLVAEPIKFWMTGHLQKRRLRNFLYEDMASVAYRLQRIVDWSYLNASPMNTQERHQRLWSRNALREIRLDRFRHFVDTEKSTFYRLPEAAGFSDFYSALESLKAETTMDIKGQVAAIGSFLTDLYSVLVDTHLNEALLRAAGRRIERRVQHQIAWEVFLQELSKEREE